LKTVMLVLKIAVSALLLLLVISMVDVHEMRARLMRADPFWLTLALVALACQFLISTLRWRDVSGALGLDVTYGQAVSLGMVGQLFNQILPTNFGGDGVRILALSRQGWDWTRAARAVLVDRAIGLLFIIGAAALSLLVLLARGTPAIPRGGLILLVVGGLLLGAILSIAIGAPLAQRWQARFGALRPVASGLSGLREALSSPKWTPPILTKALLVHLLLVQSFCFQAAALGVEINRALFMLVTLIILATAFPLSFAGWGVREGATVTGLALIGVSSNDAILISVLHGVGQIVIGLLGIFCVPFWLFGRRDP
jgi:uncharacterized membrane protein YbhN (UPF0104 family)